jgi:BlaI family penicillinase repressor
MAPRLSKLEIEIMEALWTRGPCPIREIQEAFPESRRPAYMTIQTTVYRMEAKKVLRRVRKIGNAHIFEAVVTRQAAERRLIDELLSLFGGCAQPVVARLIESGKLTQQDVREAKRLFEEIQREEGKK